MRRIDSEIAHGKKIIHSAEFYWGWGSPAGQERLRRRVELVKRYAKLTSGHVSLELGCGKGLYTREFMKSGATIVPIDISLQLLLVARANAPQGAFLQGDAHCLPFSDASFDSIIGISVLHHLDMDQALPECKRVLRPRGKFVFCEPNMLNPQIFIERNVPFIRPLMGNSPDETAFRRWPLHRQLASTGFSVSKIIPFDFLHPWTPKLLIPCVRLFGKVMEKIPLLREIAGSVLVVACRS
ncbi:MAG: class I SAM-dependent methyltransferase [Candidatus Sumerlaeota bacterium]|nr:class I SAM-dependent methyltransferase [Candidatus Sumerlaeota bacterium]